MPAERKPEAGGFNLNLKNTEQKKRLAGAEIEWMLDQSAKCTVQLACDSEWLGKLSPRDFQESLTVDWKGSCIFQGHLTGYRQSDSNRLTLIYEDQLSLFKKTYDHSFIKSNSLSSVLEAVAGLGKTSADLQGDFGGSVPSFSLEGRSLYENLTDLGARFGFFFTADQKGERIQMIRAGNHVGNKTIDLSVEPHQTQIEVSNEHLYEKLNVKFFDSKNLEATEKEFGQSQLYSKIHTFQEHSGYSAKTSWKSSKTSHGIHASDSDHFEGLEGVIPFQLSKLALQQEVLKLSCFVPGITPGQILNLESPIAGNILAGKFFVLGCHYQFLSAIPKVTVIGVRA